MSELTTESAPPLAVIAIFTLLDHGIEFIITVSSSAMLVMALVLNPGPTEDEVVEVRGGSDGRYESVFEWFDALGMSEV